MNILDLNPKSTLKPATVFLHGFPGVRSKQNRVIAERFAASTGRRTLVPLYEGLGFSSGLFTFKQCQRTVITAVDRIISENGAIDLVGHSWGGYLSIAIAARHGTMIRKLVLMSPLINFFNEQLCSSSFAQTARDNPQLHLDTPENLAREFVDLGQAEPARSLAQKIAADTEVTILQSIEDQITPRQYAEALLEEFKSRPRYELIETDHGFIISRDKLTERIVDILSTP